MLVYVSVFAWQTGIRAVQQTRAGEVWEAAGGFIPVWPSRWLLPIAARLMGSISCFASCAMSGAAIGPSARGDIREGGI